MTELLQLFTLKQVAAAADLLHMRTLLIAAILSLLCVWPESSLAGRGHAVTGGDSGLALNAEGESEEEGREGEANISPDAEEAEAEAAEEQAAATEEEEEEEEEQEEQAGGLGRSRSGHDSGRHSIHVGHLAVISQLDLSAKAKSGLRPKAPATYRVTFSFTLNDSAKLQVTLVEQTFRHGRARWVPMHHSIVLNAHKGRGAGNLSGHSRLSPGHYRLTVKPAGGRSRSIYLTVRGR